MNKSQELVEKAADKVEGILKNNKIKFFLCNWRTIVMMVYVLSPIDVIPDALGPVGFIDDVVVVVVMVISLARQYAKTDFCNRESVASLAKSAADTVSAVNEMRSGGSTEKKGAQDGVTPITFGQRDEV